MSKLTVGKKDQYIALAVKKAMEKYDKENNHNKVISNYDKTMNKYDELMKKEYLDPSDMKLVNSVPDDWFKHKEFFMIGIETVDKDIKITRIDALTQPEGKSRRIFKLPYRFHGYSPPATRVLKYSHPLVRAKDNYELALQDKNEYDKKWNEHQRQVFSEVKQIVSQFNTHKQFQDGWPELYNLLPKEEAAKLPATADLNSKIGIG